VIELSSATRVGCPLGSKQKKMTRLAPLVTTLLVLIALQVIVAGVTIDADPIVDHHVPSDAFQVDEAEQFRNLLKSTPALRDDIMKRFQDYLRVPTQQPKPDYHAAVKFVKDWSDRIFKTNEDPLKETDMHAGWKVYENSKIKQHIFYCNPEKISFILTIKGKNPERGAVFINSHTDVVPVDKDQWMYDPYAATMVIDEERKDRRVYARGAQDMKCVGTGYMEAIDRLVQLGWQPSRTLHVIFVADEEIGGGNGWSCLAESKDLKGLWTELNVTFGLDEGLASGENEDVIPIYYGENVAWWFEITATGNVGHGSQFIPETATEKLHRLLRDKVFPFREQQQIEMRIRTNNPREKNQCGMVVTINLTGLRAGHINKETGSFSNPNVIPGTATALFDMRVPPHVDVDEVNQMLQSWAKYANGTITFIQQHMDNPVADMNDELVKKFLNIVNSRMQTEMRIFPAATDARFPRVAGVNVLGYSYMPRTKVLLHDHNEYLDESVYLESIVHYIAIIKSLLE